MIIPVRCFTCGKAIGHLWDKYIEVKERYESSSQEKITEELSKAVNLKRYCCKRMLVCNVNIIDELLKYNKVK